MAEAKTQENDASVDNFLKTLEDENLIVLEELIQGPFEEMCRKTGPRNPIPEAFELPPRRSRLLAKSLCRQAQ